MKYEKPYLPEKFKKRREKMDSLFPMKFKEKIKFKFIDVFNKKFVFIPLLCILIILILFLLYLKLSIFKKSEILAIINNRPVKIQDILQEIQYSPEFYKEYIKGDPTVLLNDYINQILLYQVAKKSRNIDKKKINAMVQRYKQELLVKEFIENEIAKKIEVSPEEINNYYYTHLKEFIIPEKVRIYEIVIGSEEKAKNILNRLIAGEKFESIAMKESISPTKEKGGDLGWIDVNKLQPEIKNIVSMLEPGQIFGDVIKTELGYHIIKVAGKGPTRIQTLEEATPSIKNLFVSQRKKKEVENFINQLREKSKIAIFEGNIKKFKQEFE